MNLVELQRRMFEAMATPLTSDELISDKTSKGEPMAEVVDEIIKPNDRLSAVERLEIYSRSYWFRIISSFNEDFVGLRAVIGDKRFDALAEAYLAERPSRSYTLRNLGSRLEEWLRANPKWTHPHERLALDMVRLEWADTESFDAADDPPLTLDAVHKLGMDPILRLQPHIRLLDLMYPVNDLLLQIREEDDEPPDDASNSFAEPRKRARLKSVRSMKPKPLFIVVHRSDFSVYFKRVEREAFAMLVALRVGKTLSQAVEGAFTKSKLSESAAVQRTQTWFREWAEAGWFSSSC
jgi:hypothetical protein